MAGLIAALLIPVVFFPPFRLIEARLYDLLSVIAPPRPSQPGAIVVAIDEPSFSEIGQRWPWSRELHARLVESLRAAGAKVVAFDIIFAEPSTEEADSAFAKALGPGVVLAADVATIVLNQGTQITQVNPLDPFLDAGAVAGIASVDPDGDGYLRRMPTLHDGFAAEALRLSGAQAAPAPDGALIQYFGPDRSYPTASYYQALDPANFLPPGYFKDQIVLVGLSPKTATTADASTPDTFLTPYTLTEGTLTAGVEVQATILDNLRHGLYVLPAPPWAMVLLVLAGAMLAAALCTHGVSWRTGLSAFFVLAFFFVGAWAVLRFSRVWVPPALPAAAALAVFGTRFGLDYARERHLRRAVSEAFSRYLSPELVAQLARDPGALKLGGERRNLSVLFCDVRGFTTLSEKLKDEPERLTALINRLLDPLSEAILAEGGTIDKYIGDCVMAFWNAPLPCPDHPLRAARAALRMLEAVARLNAELRREQGEDAPVFAIGVGINTGDCVVGNVGSRWRYDYSVLGDTVNLASRLESLSKEYGVSIVLGPATAKALQDHFVLIELDRIAVKGRTERSTVFTILAPKNSGQDKAFSELTELHPTVLDSIGAGKRGEALALIDQCRTLAPSLSTYYGKLRLKASAIEE
ncbi:adenylate cyclase [Microvirga flocculans]|uniref:Adenylate cyclase n=1 Tax=Microvirga flocculans TaxID=217168 RepID=A0A7W6IGX5_9HYPH|nr:adenylate/guanylate cyclase domain-containing protein [Microvirga flocculans]MBB4041258.1 adenylate cyclase [Microvirga flocculans]